MERTLGTEPNYDANYKASCPVCGSDIDRLECEGYGLAFGGGLGSYLFCPAEDCKWFYKWLDAEETVRS
jgi:hypothetical protein